MNSLKLFPLDDVELGYLFFQKRKNKGISQKQAAIESGISQPSITRFENGELVLGMKNIILYANYLELNLKFCIAD